MTYQESIDWLYSAQLFGIKLGLENPRRLLREYLAFPPRHTTVIHVAGTNGKGSVCAFLDSVARATGRRVGLFTSPHLIDFRERIRVSGAEISEDDTIRHLSSLRTLVSGWDPHPTFFELTLAIALKHFAEQSCELLVLETGMGGRLDATTAVPADVAVLTRIDLDHQQYLGDTLAAIAGEKAGIIRQDKPVFSAAQDEEALTVIRQTANERRALLTVVDEPLRGYSLGLTGPHQFHNAALALASLHAAGVQLTYEVVKHGLQSTRHPGRFEILPPRDREPPGSPQNPAAAPGPRASGSPHNPGPPNPDAPLVLDIAHNPAAAAALAATWHAEFGDRKASLYFGVVADKDLAGILHHLLPLAAEIHLVPFQSPRAVPPDKVRALLPADAPPVTIHADLAGALRSRSHDTPTLLTGSAFLVGEARALLTAAPHRASNQ